jgi:hypothetical protein
VGYDGPLVKRKIRKAGSAIGGNVAHAHVKGRLWVQIDSD